MFNFSIPKYTEFAPPCQAAVSAEKLPAGAMISVGFLYVFI